MGIKIKLGGIIGCNTSTFANTFASIFQRGQKSTAKGTTRFIWTDGEGSAWFSTRTGPDIQQGGNTAQLLDSKVKPIIGKLIMLIKKLTIVFASSILALTAIRQSAEPPKDHWSTFPNTGVEKVVVTIHTTDVSDPVLPKLFVGNHSTIKEFTINDAKKATELAQSITGASGIAGAKLSEHQRTFAEAMGTISFYRKAERFDVTISNAVFFMGPELNDYHLFYSWRLAKLVNDISLKYGKGLSQEGFNSLSGARGIANAQFFEICDGNWDNDAFHAYESRKANVWDILPSFDDWKKFKQ